MLTDPNKVYKFEVHTAYAHAVINRASEQPAQHDTEAITEWEQRFMAPTRRLY